MKLGLAFVIFSAVLNCNAILGPICLSCKALERPEDCTIVTKCGEHEMCFLEKYVTNDGLILHDTGCKDMALCSLASSSGFGKRRMEYLTKHRRDNLVVCSDCCDSKNICNQYGCGLPPVQLPMGSKLCYKCLSSTHPDTCNQLALCNKNQYCSISEQRNLLGQIRWQHDCIDKQLCANSSSPCSQCCNSELCNGQCGSVGITQIPIAGISKTTTTSTTTQITTFRQTTHLPTSATVGSTTTQPTTVRTTETPTLTTVSITTTQPTTLRTTEQPTSTTLSSTTTKPTTLRTTEQPTSTTLSSTTTKPTSLRTTEPPTSTTQARTTRVETTTSNPLSVPIIIQVNRHPDRIHLGDTVVISCVAIGNPTPTYTYKYRDGPLPKNGQVRNNTLILSNFLTHNNGNYECIAINSLGTGNYGFVLQLT